jgi:hypothetical protein
MMHTRILLFLLVPEILQHDNLMSDTTIATSITLWFIEQLYIEKDIWAKRDRKKFESVFNLKMFNAPVRISRLRLPLILFFSDKGLSSVVLFCNLTINSSTATAAHSNNCSSDTENQTTFRSLQDNVNV